jgi:hypothetical protein
VVPSSDSPIAETSRTTSCTKTPYPAPSYTTPPPLLSSETALPIPPPPPFALAPASIPLATLPNPCLPTSSISPASYHFTHHYPHHPFHPFQPLPSSQHPQCLPSLGYPSISLLLVELVKHFCGMLPSHLQWPCHTYLALGGVRIRLTENGIKVGGFFLKGGKGSLSPSREDALNGRYLPLLRGPGGIRPGR